MQRTLCGDFLSICHAHISVISLQVRKRSKRYFVAFFGVLLQFSFAANELISCSDNSKNASPLP